MSYQSIPFLVVTHLLGLGLDIPFFDIHPLGWSILPVEDFSHEKSFRYFDDSYNLSISKSFSVEASLWLSLPKTSLHISLSKESLQPVLPQHNILYGGHDLSQSSFVTKISLFHAFLLDNHCLSSLDRYFHLTFVHMHT